MSLPLPSKRVSSFCRPAAPCSVMSCSSLRVNSLMFTRCTSVRGVVSIFWGTPAYFTDPHVILCAWKLCEPGSMGFNPSSAPTRPAELTSSGRSASGIATFTPSASVDSSFMSSRMDLMLPCPAHPRQVLVDCDTPVCSSSQPVRSV